MGRRWKGPLVVGMRTESGIRISWVDESGMAGGIRDGDTRVRPENATVVHDEALDWEDGATRGAALEWLRGQYDHSLTTRYVGSAKGAEPWPPGPWEMVSTSRHVTMALYETPTEAELYPAAAEALKEQR